MIRIVVHDHTVFDEYKEGVLHRVIRAEGSHHVLWDLSGLHRVPWEHFYSQVQFLSEIRHCLWEKIPASTILVNGEQLKSFLQLLFQFYKPVSSVNIVMNSR